MEKKMFKPLILGTVVAAFALASCKKDDNGGSTEPPVDESRWITLSGAIDDPSNTNPADGDAGTMVYSLTAADAKNPSITVNVFNDGMHVKSSRTARLQASADGNFLYNIQYTGDDGGIFNKYSVHGANDFRASGAEVETATYVSSSPRWLKAAEGIGIAVRGTANAVVYEGTSPDFVFKERTAKIDILSLDLNDPKIINTTTTAKFSLSEEETAAGYYISRIDVPVVNKAGNKVYIGVAISKVKPESFTIGTDGTPTFATDNASPKAWAKTIVADYPALTNPTLISSSNTRANTNGYRSTMQYIGTDGNVYQATSGEGYGNGGSKILKINASGNDYDNSYVFSLDAALGLSNTYIETWRYVGDGIGFVVYSLVSSEGERTGGYIARINLNDKTATKYTLPNESSLYFGQIQNIAQNGNDVFIAVAVPGQQGNIYVFNKETGEMSAGAKLGNQTGGQYIGAY
ncbi:MAG: hypothetical protein BGP13_14660 [Sphingobacteriales bacterium 40-81]|nr:MAG: hypothetical protein BGP13_14660 [Sphingobacteriales bacterium 40-81]